MITKENVTVYQCEFCKKSLFRKHAMEKHINWCGKNPKNFNICSQGCVHLEETTIEYQSVYNNGYCDEQVSLSCKAFRCNAKNKLVYPLIVQKKGLPEKYPETFEDQEPMPKECGEYKDLLEELTWL